MQFTVHFRGVAAYVAKNRGNVTEVLFPNAETKAPPDGVEGDKKPNGHILGKGMKHADGKDAPQHFAGAMIIGPGNTRIYRKLQGRLVKRDTLGPVARPQNQFLEKTPPLANVITNQLSKIRLLDADKHGNFDRIAARFILDSGDIYPDGESRGTWTLAGGIHGPNAATNQFALEGRWTFTAAAPVHLNLCTLDGKLTDEEPIVLDANHPEVYFYNYDIGLPTKDDLTEEEIPPSLNLSDHDFKWNYALFDRVNGTSQPRWQDWLQGVEFPAPQLIGLPEPPPGLSVRLITVSTCFQIVWTD